MANPNMAPEGVAVAGAQPGFSAQEMQPAGAGAGVGAAAGPGMSRNPQGMSPPGRDEIGELQRVLSGA